MKKTIRMTLIAISLVIYAGVVCYFIVLPFNIAACDGVGGEYVFPFRCR